MILEDKTICLTIVQGRAFPLNRHVLSQISIKHITSSLNHFEIKVLKKYAIVRHSLFLATLSASSSLPLPLRDGMGVIL